MFNTTQGGRSSLACRAYLASTVLATLLILQSRALADPVLFFSSYNNGTIYALDASGTVSPYVSTPGPGGLALDAAGNLYTANYNAGTVTKITPDRDVSTYASGFSYPWGLAFDASGNLYVSNTGISAGTTISKITPNAASVSIFATGLSQPVDMAFDSQGYLYVANYGTGAVSKITPAGDVSTFAQVGLGAYGLAIDADDNVYVGINDVTHAQYNGVIYKITPGGTINTFATGVYDPYGMCADASGNIYVGTDLPPTRSADIFVFDPVGNRSILAADLVAATDVLAVPEPASLALLGIGAGLLLMRRRGHTN
jgi:sugar lactone lactonase YvrE